MPRSKCASAERGCVVQDNVAVAAVGAARQQKDIRRQRHDGSDVASSEALRERANQLRAGAQRGAARRLRSELADQTYSHHPQSASGTARREPVPEAGQTTQAPFQILDRTSGAVVVKLNIGGGDQIAYDSVSNRWFLADSRWTATGNSCGGGSATCPLTPILAVVDASSHTWGRMLFKRMPLVDSLP